MKTDELREKYLAFFEGKGHARKASDVLVPHGDPSVLFTPAGMNQFKDHFLGKVKLEFTRATTCQKCLRTGDIDNVGRTAFHHTFFEMLGNFSFGDYFKREAIHWAWEFLTDKKWLAIDPTRLKVSVFLDDDEAAGIWHNEIGVPESRIVRMGEDDNFWPAGAPSNGPDGVCGPCSEIFYTDDRGGEVEIWNLVFTQFNRVGEPPDNLRPLPSKNIDTGMGLERIASVMQGVSTNFHIDSLRPIVDAAAQVCGRKYDATSDDGRRLRRITDHVRAATFAVHENVEPDNKKQGYVIRRLLRRAVLDGHQMGMREPFLHRLVEVVVDCMKAPYPELLQTRQRVAEEIRDEERAFFGTIDAGMARIQQVFTELSSSGRMMVAGEEAADLYTTYGVPPELFQQLANERGMTFDWNGYRAAMERHGEISGGQQVAVFKTGAVESIKAAVQRTEFVGYDTTSCDATVRGLVADGSSLESFDRVAAEVTVVLDCSPFYGESGGQVGDTGRLVCGDAVVEVTDTQKDGELLLHFGKLVSGTLRVGAKVKATVDTERRQAIRRAHSATHLLHHALQANVGEHAQQRGSKVEADQFRFDFKNRAQIEADILEKIERDVVARVRENAAVAIDFLPIDQARNAGAMMLFGEKYPDVVRMVSMGDFSKELCGGTHLSRTGEVGPFEIIAEEAVSAGTRRITAYTGARAEAHQAEVQKIAEELARHLGVATGGIVSGTRRLLDRVRELKKRLAGGGISATEESLATGTPIQDYAALRSELRDAAKLLNVSIFETVKRVQALLEEAERLGQEVEALVAAEAVSADSLLETADRSTSTAIVIAELPVANPNFMRQLANQLRQKADPSVVVLGAVDGDRCQLLVGVSPAAVAKISAGDVVRKIAPIVGGGGGGRPDMAQAGGKDGSKLPEALAAAKRLLLDSLGG